MYCLQTIPFTAKDMTYGDIMEAFLYTFRRDIKYIYVLYDYDANVIITDTLNSLQVHKILKAWKTLYEQMTWHGHEMTNFILDNEYSNELKKVLQKRHYFSVSTSR